VQGRISDVFFRSGKAGSRVCELGFRGCEVCSCLIQVALSDCTCGNQFLVPPYFDTSQLQCGVSRPDGGPRGPQLIGERFRFDAREQVAAFHSLPFVDTNIDNGTTNLRANVCAMGCAHFAGDKRPGYQFRILDANNVLAADLDCTRTFIG
jgi:hypothetical protein